MSLHDWAAQLPNHQDILKTRNDKIQSSLQQIDNGITTKSSAELMRGLKKAETIKGSAILLTPQETKEFVQRALYVCTEAHQQWAELSAVTRAVNVATAMLTPRTPALVPLVSDFVSWDRLLVLASEFEPNHTTEKRLASEEVLKAYTDALGQLFRIARYYQRENSAEPVWNQFKSAVQLQDSPHMYEAQLHMYLFYPGGPLAQPATQEMFEEWMEAWGLVDHNSGWDSAWFGVVKRALKSNPQLQVDAHLNRFFGRFYANLKLGGNGNGENSSSTRKFSPWQQAMSGAVRFVKAAKLLVQLLHVGDAIKRLEHFVQSVHTFMHPSNHGSHAERLSSFLSFLCEAFAKRLGAHANSLPQDTKKRFIVCLYPLIEMGLYSKSLAVVASCQAALRHLAWLAPVTMAKLTLDVVRQGLDPTNVSRSHQTAAGMKILTATIQPLVFGSQASRNVVLPELCDFLENSLPGLDPNDSRKTAVTLLMAYSVMSCVPLISAEKFTSSEASCSASFGIDSNGEAMEVEVTDLAFGNRLEEWGLSFFRRLFALAQSRGQRAKKGISAQMDNVIDFFFQETISLCYTQLVFRRRDALKEISQFLIHEAALPDAHHEASSFASGLVRVDPESAVNELMPTLLERIQSNGDSKTVAWSLVVLGAVVRKAGHFSLKFAAQIHQAIIRSFAHKDSKVRYLGCKLIRRLARGLLATYPFLNAGDGEFDPVYEKHDLTVNWHIPNDQEVQFATNMLIGFKQLAFDLLLQASNAKQVEMDPSVTEKERTNHLLTIVFQSIRGGSTHLNRDNEQDVDRVIACTAMLEQTSNIFGLKLCAKSLVLLASKAQGPKGGGNESYLYSYKAWTAWLRDISQNRAIETQIKQKARDEYAQNPSVGTGFPARPSYPLKHMMLRDYEFLQEKETYFASFPLVTKDTVLKPCGTVLNLCFHHSSEVRKCAQTHLEYADLRCRFALREQVRTEVIPKLKSSKPEEFTGAIYLLRHGSALRLIGMNLDALDQFLCTALGDDNALEKLPAFRQAKAQERLARLVGSVLNRWQEILQVDPAPLCSKLVAMATKPGGGDWRTQLTVLTVIAILKPARAVNDDVARFVFEMTKHEMLPTRLASFFVLRTLLLAEERQADAKPHMRNLMQSLNQDQVTLLYTSAGSTLGQDRSSGEDQWSAGVGDNIKLVKTQVKPPKFPQLSNNSVSRDFHCSKVDLFASYCKYLPTGVSLLPSLRELATEGESSKDRAERKLSACEIFAASLAIRPNEWTKDFFPILLRMLADLPNASNWCDAVTYIACFSQDKGQALLLEIQSELDRKSSSSDSEPETDGERERGFSYTCNLLKVLGSVLEERRDEISPNTYAKFEQFLTHPYKAVRQAAATSFALFYMHCANFDAERVVRTMLNIKDNKEGLESALCFVAVLVAVSPAKFILNQVLRPLLGPVVFEGQGHAEVETALMAKNVLHLCATHLRCFAVRDTKQVVQFEEMLIKDFATHAEWTKRRALCVFLRSFHALHATFLLGMGAGALVQRTSEDLLMDTQAEVRDAARLLLLSLLIAVPVSSLESAKDRYCRMVNNAKKRQQGILALTALVETSPYSVPSALPPSLMVLSKHVNHPLLGQQVKKTLSEFRRTHIDEWAEHHLKFSEEELSALEGVLFSPDYYA